MDMSKMSVGEEHAAQDRDGFSRILDSDEAWLHSIGRYLDAAEDGSVPSLERLRLLSRSAAELDSFVKCQLPWLGWPGQRTAVSAKTSKIPSENLSCAADVWASVDALTQRQQACWKQLHILLAAHGFCLLSSHELNTEERQQISEQFDHVWLHQLTPQAVTLLRPIPELADQAIILAFQLVGTDIERRRQHALVPIPRVMGRFFEVVSRRSATVGERKIRLVSIEAVTALFGHKLFPGYNVLASGAFRVLFEAKAGGGSRSAVGLPNFERRKPIRLELDGGMPVELQRFLIDVMEIDAAARVVESPLAGLADLGEVIGTRRPDLQFPKRKLTMSGEQTKSGDDLFAAVRAFDQVEFLAQEEFGIVANLLQQASTDKAVLAIKWFLAEARHSSATVEALTGSVDAGKFVTVATDISATSLGRIARHLQNALDRAGMPLLQRLQGFPLGVSFGFIVRQEASGVRSYCCFEMGAGCGFGLQLSFLSADPMVARDTGRLFNGLSTLADPIQLGFEHLSASPGGIRERVIDHILEEIYHARSGRSASILMKIKSLTDESTIEALYAASQAGVQVDLVVSNICRLRSGIEGLSENIRLSIELGTDADSVGVFCFGSGKGTKASQGSVYLSSADLTPHDLDERVHLLLPLPGEVGRRFLEFALTAGAGEPRWVRKIQPDGSVLRLPGDRC